MPHDNPVFSKRFNDTLTRLAMIEEMARADNWQSLDECLEIKPGAVKDFSRYADAAMRAIKRIENGEYQNLFQNIN